VSTLSIAASVHDSEFAIGLPWDWGEDPDLWLYRDRTTAILLRYLRLSVETGRLPSVLGREFFRTHVTSHNLSSFEDVVIFVHDIERCISRLEPLSARLDRENFFARIFVRRGGTAGRVLAVDGATKVSGCDRSTERNFAQNGNFAASSTAAGRRRRIVSRGGKRRKPCNYVKSKSEIIF